LGTDVGRLRPVSFTSSERRLCKFCTLPDARRTASSGGKVHGEMRERSNRAVSKTVEPLAAPWVRIPLSPLVLYFGSLLPWRTPGTACAPGEMTEWPKVHAWKACVLVRVPWVRIPLSPLTPLALMFRSYAMDCCLTPSGPEGSSGKQLVHEPYPA
jgi:hypothetical protein